MSDLSLGSFVYKSEKAEIYAIAGSNILKIQLNNYLIKKTCCFKN